jgi:endo-1,4-beta-xylanase
MVVACADSAESDSDKDGDNTPEPVQTPAPIEHPPDDTDDMTNPAPPEDEITLVVDRLHALDVTPLKDIYADYFLIGNIVNPVNLSDNAVEKELYTVLKHHYNALTFENDMKPDHVWNHPWGYSGDRYARPDIERVNNRLSQLDDLLLQLINDDFHIVGHTLVWHGQSPDWLNLSAGRRDAAEGRVYLPYSETRRNLEDFIMTVAGHWYEHPQGIRIHEWDVINEAIRRNHDYSASEEEVWGWHTWGAIWVPSGEQWNSPWFECYRTNAPDNVNPWDYVYDSFYFARIADPSSTLYYNDYGMEDYFKSRIVVNMVNAVNLRWSQSEDNPQGDPSYEDVHDYIAAGGRLLIEGIGMQQHDSIGERSHFIRVDEALKLFATTGVKISITELDVGVGGYSRGETLSEYNEIRQALHFARLFELFKKHAEHIERVSFWGVKDDRSWRGDELCLVFDSEMFTKLAYYAIADPETFIEVYG